MARHNGCRASVEQSGEVTTGVIRLFGETFLRQPRLEPDLELGSDGVRQDGGEATYRRRGDDTGHAVRRQDGDQGISALSAAIVQWPQRVWLGPRRARVRVGVTDDDQRPGREVATAVCPHQGAELVPVTGIAEPVRGGEDVEPGDLVDLVDQRPGTADDLSRPVAHLLGVGLAARVRDGIQRCRKRASEAYVEPGLLEHLACRGDRPFLARLELALGPGPVVIAGSVDHGDLQLAASATPWQGPSGRDQPVVWSRGRLGVVTGRGHRVVAEGLTGDGPSGGAVRCSRSVPSAGRSGRCRRRRGNVGSTGRRC